ncbi:MAG: chemotaxis protein CheA [Pseudomonadota bacterium]
MNMDQALQTFIIESRELLENMESALLSIEGEETTSEAINAIFRAAHTIKGSAGLFGLDHIVKFTHVVEGVLDHVRDGKLIISEELVVVLLSCCDHIGLLIEAIASGQLEEDEATTQQGLPLLEKLRGYMAPLNAHSIATVPQKGPSSINESVSGGIVDSDNWHISLRFGPEVLRNGMDPLSFIRYLQKLGTIAGVIALHDAIPAADEMDPESCYLGLEISFKSDVDKATIENVFEFVRDDCRVHILPPRSRISEYLHLIQDLPSDATRLGEMLVRCGTVTESELHAALQTQSSMPSQPLGAILVEQGVVQPAVVEAALAKQKQVKELKVQESQSIRVDAGKLDHLINLIGELIIAAASTHLLARRAHAMELEECASTLSDLVEAVHDSALQLRMVKIGATFSRFQRVVHDMSREIGKDIGLVIHGEDTELDKTVVEKIADPLTHLVRNAMDHGIEPAELRIERNKPLKGTVRLNAYHDSGSVVIEVGDDGGGLKRDRILAKAIERGLVEPGKNLSDSEIYDLIFEPGFSTAEQITNLSGRGVGMDVVKRNITALRGSVKVNSEEGVGTTITVRLPLTLAIIDGFLVGLDKSVFVVPLDMIEECIEFSAEPGHDYTNLRGHVLPFIHLRELFGIEGAPAARQNIVVVKHAGHKVGLVVDNLLGEFQTVIKPLDKMFNRVDCISGSSILGTGEVALILNVAAIFRTIEEKVSRHLAA